MMKAMLILFLMVSSQVFAVDYSLTTCKSIVPEFEAALKMTQERFSVGEITRTDLSRASLDLLNVKFDCRQIAFEDYCAQALNEAADYLASIIEDERVGQRGLDEVSVARREVQFYKNRCL